VGQGLMCVLSALCYELLLDIPVPGRSSLNELDFLNEDFDMLISNIESSIFFFLVFKYAGKIFSRVLIMNAKLQPIFLISK